MSTESILTLVGIGVTIMLFLLGIVVTVVGFLLSRQLKSIETELAHIRPLELRVNRLETLAGIKRPSDVIKMTPQAGESSA